jgi:isopropylmalate/homocitrate/citramalate synthase
MEEKMKKDFACHTDQYWVSELNFLPEIYDKLNIPDKVLIHDVTLRETDQTPGSVLRAEEKIEMAKELQALGVYSIEIFPVVSREDFEALKEISSWKDRIIETCALARCIKEEIDLAAEAGVDRVNIEGPSSAAFNKFFRYKDENEVVDKMTDAIKYALSLGLKATAYCWDTGKSTLPLLERFYKSVTEAGADQALIADSFGICMPWTIHYLTRKIYEWTEGKIIIAPHFHNDYGLGLANTMAAVAAGSSLVNSAINSVGEKTGNVATEEVAVVLELLMGVDSGIDLSRIYHVAKKMEAISKIPIHPSKPITGSRTHDLASGLILDWFAKTESDYEKTTVTPFMPSLIGAPDFRVLWGKGVGTNMVFNHAKDIGVPLTREQAVLVRDRIKKEALIRKSLLTEHEVDNYIKEVATE